MSAPAHVEQLRSRLAPTAAGTRRLLSVPGCWDGLTALLVEQGGFEAAFLTGGGLAMARLGRPDIGLVTATEAADAVMAIRDRVALPLIADGDTGFGNAINLQRTVRLFERAGASAIQIEDQGFPKRCGHMAGKTVVPIAEAVGRIRATLDAREHMLVVARTDAVSVEGFDSAIERAEAFLAAGADLIFVEGPETLGQLEGIGRRFGARAPLVHNLVEGGTTPTESGDELERAGFAVALHPLLLMHGFIRQAPRWLAALRAERATTALASDIARLGDINALVGAAPLLELGESYD